MAKMQHVVQALYNLVPKDEPLRLDSGPTQGAILYSNTTKYFVGTITDAGAIVDIQEFSTNLAATNYYDTLIAGML